MASQARQQNPISLRVRGGLGIQKGFLGFDYAFVPSPELGAAHRFTVNMKWGGSR